MKGGWARRLQLISRVGWAGLTHRVRPKVRQLILHVTKKCNFRCRHCFVDFSEIPKDMTLETIRGIARTVGRLIWLDIGGGEPFLRKDLVELVSLFRFEEVSIPTNAWFTDQVVKTANRLAARFPGKVTIVCSVDGPRRTHDEIRREPGSFDRLMETYQLLEKIDNLRVVFLSTLCDRNAEELLDLLRFTRTLKPDYHAVNIMRGKPIDPTYRLMTQNAKLFYEELKKFYGEDGYGKRLGIGRIPLNYVNFRWQTSIRTLEEERQVIPCLGGTATLVIQPNGDVGPCETLPPVANLYKMPLGDILKAEPFREVVRSVEAGDCFCTHECNLKSSIFLNPKLYPKLVAHP